ncbi:hypothetical protein HYU22_04065 [Candidatus Woesearchaeota archaeon]|nr:hypothetical protein [Candidatus Woesearchaeota archaeon]
MTMGKRDVEKRLKDVKAQLTALEAKCKDGSGSKEDYIELTRLRRKLK